MLRWNYVVLVIVLLLGVMLCLYLIATRELKSTETLLLSLMLTILSLIGSWVASKYYSEVSFNSNLRVFALKAAEKVNNLSNELDRLSAFLQQEQDPSNYSSPVEELLAKDIRTEGAIHIINTLKSVNDRSLSDWQGVIGDELSAQQEEREERERELKEIVERVESLTLELGDRTDHGNSATAFLSSEVASLKSDLRTITSQISGIPVKRPKVALRQTLEFSCPECAELVKYDQKIKENSHKSLACQNCKTKLVSMYKNGKFSLVLNEPKLETVNCPSCDSNINVMIGIVNGQGRSVMCTECDATIRVTRTKDGINQIITGIPPHKAIITEDLLQRVRESMPPQPWATGTRRLVAHDLDIPTTVLGYAINELMRRGVFKAQVDGKLFVLEENKPAEEV